MRIGSLVVGIVVSVGLLGCDNNNSTEKEPDLGLPKGADMKDLKQAKNTQMTQEELEEARRKAGFKSPEERMAEAKAEYEKNERIYVKGKIGDYRKLVGELRKEIDKVEKSANTWAESKSGEKAFAKFHDKYKAEAKTLLDKYDALTEKGSRGGNLQVALDEAVRTWENLNNDLGPEIAKADQFATVVTGIKEKLAEVEKNLDEIEKDETLKADAAAAPEGAAGKKAAGEPTQKG